MNTIKYWIELTERIRGTIIEKIKQMLRTRNRNTFYTTDVMRYTALVLIAFSMSPVDRSADYMISGYVMAGFILADACYYGTHFKQYFFKILFLEFLTEPLFDYMAAGRILDMQIQNPLLLTLVILIPLRYLNGLQKNADSPLYPYRHFFYYVIFAAACLLSVKLNIPYPEITAPAMVLPVIFRRYRTFVLLFMMLLACMSDCGIAVVFIVALFFYNDRRLPERTKLEKWMPYLFYMLILILACMERAKGGGLCHITNMQ